MCVVCYILSTDVRMNGKGVIRFISWQNAPSLNLTMSNNPFSKLQIFCQLKNYLFLFYASIVDRLIFSILIKNFCIHTSMRADFTAVYLDLFVYE